MKVYFARPENVAGTKLDTDLINQIRSHDYFTHSEIIAPCLPLDPQRLWHEQLTRHLVISAQECSVFIFLPFPDGAIHNRHGRKMGSLHLIRTEIFEINPRGALQHITERQRLHERVLGFSSTHDRLWDQTEHYMHPYH